MSDKLSGTYGKLWGQLQRLPHFAWRDISCLLLVTANVLWFWESLTLVFVSSLQDEHSQQYSHVVLIPIVCLYMLYLRRKAIFATVEWRPLLGSTLTVVGGVVSFSSKDSLGETIDSFSPSIFSFVMMCWGAFLFCYGKQALYAASFELGLSTFMIPLPSFVLDSVVSFLQRGSADAVQVLFVAFDIPVLREGFIFKLSDFTILIAEECSGIRSFLSLIITSLVAGRWLLKSWWTRAALVAMVVPLAIIKNAFRIVGLALLANYVDPTFITDSALHRSGGIPIFLFSLVVLSGIVLFLRQWEGRLTARGGSVRDDYA